MTIIKVGKFRAYTGNILVKYKCDVCGTEAWTKEDLHDCCKGGN